MKNSLLVSCLVSFMLGSGCMCAQAAGFADGHTSKGVPCEACHVSKEKPQMPTINNCVKCHELEALTAKTASVKPQNPHTSPHYQNKLECNNCHIGHEPSENFCGQCHNFEYKVP